MHHQQSHTQVDTLGQRRINVSLPELMQAHKATTWSRVCLLREGIPARVIPILAPKLGWSQARLIQTMALPLSTVRKKISKGEKLNASQSERLLALVDLLAAAERLAERAGVPEDFDVFAWLGTWLLAPAPALGGRSPASCFDTLEGFALVKGLLGALEHGIYL